MNEDHTSEPNPQAPIEPPLASPAGKELVIQPSETLKQEIAAQKPVETAHASPQVPANTIYPEATENATNPDSNNLTTSQQFAVAATRLHTEKSNRPVSLRVKSVLVIAILTLLSAAYSLVNSISLAPSEAGVFGIVITCVSLIQLGMSIYLLVGKDHNTAALILKIYLVFQLISLFFSLVNPVALAINALVVLFLFYVYTRVKSLSY